MTATDRDLRDCLSYDIADTCIRLGRAGLVDAAIACDWTAVARELAATLCGDEMRHERDGAIRGAQIFAAGDVVAAARVLADVRDDEMTLDAWAAEVLAEMAAAAASGVDRIAQVSL